MLFDGYPCVQIPVSSNACNPKATLAQRLAQQADTAPSGSFPGAEREARELSLSLHARSEGTRYPSLGRIHFMQ